MYKVTKNSAIDVALFENSIRWVGQILEKRRRMWTTLLRERLMLLLRAVYPSLEDWAGPLMEVSWRRINSRDASPSMMGRFGDPSWVKPTSVPDQQLIYPQDEAVRYLSSSANRTKGTAGHQLNRKWPLPWPTPYEMKLGKSQTLQTNNWMESPYSWSSLAFGD